MKGTLKRLLIVLIAISMVVMPTTLGYAYADETTGEAVSEETAEVATLEGDAVEGPDLTDFHVARLGEAEAADLDEGEEETSVSGIITKEELDSMTEAELDQTVRVSIVLSKAPVLDRYSVEKVNSFAAKNYRKSLKNQQAAVEKDINKALGKSIDVKWNLTLAINVMSVEVTYRDIKDILEVKGVESVQRENRYEALVDEAGTAEPNTALTSEYMVGAQDVWAEGYTGAGQRVAIIDTGADIEHQSFDAGAFDYAIQKYEEKFNTTVDLMEASDIDLEELNGNGHYLNSKMPYVYNYVDEDQDVIHINDKEGDHGSHVAGIAAANRYIPDGGSYVDALDGTYAVGMAPDAQILVMKVFGKAGGAYDSDYMAAIEDAVVLECDSCNLSLGSAAAGFTYDTVYQDALNALSSTNTVAAISAGNSYDWGATNAPYGMLYADSTIFNTVGSPGSFINAFTVAAAQNTGSTGSPFLFNGEKVFYTETDSGAPSMVTLDKTSEGTGTEYDFVYLDAKGYAEEYVEANKVVSLKGNFVMVNRGGITFAEKGNNVNKTSMKPAGLAVVNNTNGSISMALDDYKGKFPFVSINGEDRDTILAAVTGSQEVTATVKYDVDEDGVTDEFTSTFTVYTGKITVTGKVSAENSIEREDATITDFSSWGVPESLLLKPEITAPGGGIYSVYGLATTSSGEEGGHDKYTLMSGTSMAAPHIAGLSALIKQHLEENDPGEFNSELTDKYTLRAIAQSLMMSTATPMINDGMYLPVIQQGAGLVEISKAINATSVVMIDNAFLTVPTGAAADGKVKVELGADLDKVDGYNYSFSIYNITDEDQYFELNSDFFTQDLYYEGLFHDTYTRDLDVTVNYQWRAIPEVEGQGAHDVDKDGDTDADDAQAILDYLTGARPEDGLILEAGEMDGDGTLTTYDAHLLLNYTIGDGPTNYILPAGGKAEVYVTVTLNEDLSEYPAGAYIEGFTYANCVNATDEGLSLETSHSIPVLGFYGNWTDSSMFDYTSKVDVINYGEDEVWPSYTGNYSNYFLLKQGTTEFIFSGNPYVPEEEFPADRLAMRSDTLIKKVYYNLIRNASDTGFAVSKLNEDGGIAEVLSATIKNILVYGVYTDTSGVQQNTGVKNCVVEKTPADYGLVEGDLFRAGFYAVPEYTAMLYTAETHMSGEGHMYFAENGYLAEDEEFAGVIEKEMLGDGAYVGYDFVVDDTLPTLTSVDLDQNAKTVTIKASDNEHLAFVGLVSLDGEEFYAYEVPEEADATVVLDIADVMNDIPKYAAVLVGDYAGNEVVQLLQVNNNASEFDDPNAPAEVVLSETNLTLYRGNSTEVSAKVIPITATNTNAVWTSSNENIVTVDDGTVTAVAAGEADITATSEANPNVSATCHVTVVSVDGNLGAVAWDFKIEGNENESIVTFGTASSDQLQNYTPHGDYKGISTTTAYYGLKSGAQLVPTELYVGTFDYSSADSAIYKVDSNYNFIDNDTTTQELDPYGIGYLPLVDLALAYPSANSLVDMAYVYGPYFVIGNGDPTILASIEDLAQYTGQVGLPLIVTYHPRYETNDEYFCAVALKGYNNEYEPEFYLMDDQGVLWEATTDWVETAQGDDLKVTLTELFNTGLEPFWLRQSLFYDDELDALYFANCESGVGSTLYLIDVEKQSVIEMGDFGEDVWPVTGLFNKPTTGFNSKALDNAAASTSFTQNVAKVEANMAELEAFREKVAMAEADGTTNRMINVDKLNTGNTAEIDSIEPTSFTWDEDLTDVMFLSENEDSTNGFATITYDPEVLKFTGASRFIEHTSVFVDEENGLIKFAYADKDVIESYMGLEILYFEFEQTCTESTVTVTTTQRNDDFDLNEVEEVKLMAHEWGEWEFDEENEMFNRECEKCGELDSEPFPNRVYGKNRYATAMEIANECQKFFGGDKFDSVVVATGDAFPDALTGSYLSIKNFAPMLLINKQDKVKDEVLEYIEANVVAGANVYLLGGKNAVDESFEAALTEKGFIVTRLSGKGRYDTNLAILEQGGDPGPDLLVCSGLDWPDAATASASGLPILIVGKELTDAQKDYLEGQSFENIYVVGGKAVVSEDMLNALKPYADNVKRVSGKNRAATAIAVAEEFHPDGMVSVAYAYQSNFPDCISGGLLAYLYGSPILYGPGYVDLNSEFIANLYDEGWALSTPYVFGGKKLVTTEFCLEAFAPFVAETYGYGQ